MKTLMGRRLNNGLLLPFARLAVAAVVSLPASAQQPTFPSGVGLVRIDAVVVDGRGRPVEGLRASDFELLEDGRPQPIESFEAVALRGRPSPAGTVELPRASRATRSDGALFVLFYDDLHLTPAYTGPARSAIRRFLAEGTRPGDRVTIVAPAQGLWWSARVPDEQADLVALSERLAGRRLRGDGRLDYQAMLVHHRGEDGLLRNQVPGAVGTAGRAAEQRGKDESEFIQQMAANPGTTEIPSPPSLLMGGSPDLRGMGNPIEMAEMEAEYAESVRLNRLSLDAMRDAVAALASVPGRKSFIVVSEGMVEDPALRQYEQIVEAARVSNTVVYFLDVRGLELPAAATASADATTAGSAAAGRGQPPVRGRETRTGLDPTRFQDQLSLDLLLRRGAAVGSERLADETGGLTLHGNDLGDGLLRVAAESHAFYLLGYRPDDTARAGFRKVKVRVKRPGVEVRSRPGWRPLRDVESPVAAATAARAEAVPPGGSTPVSPAAGASTTAAGDPASAATRAAAPRDALDLLARSGADLAEVPLSVSAYTFDETGKDALRVIVAADVDLPPAADGTEIAYRLVVVRRGEPNGLEHAGRETLAASRELPWTGGFGTHAPLARTFELAPGRYQARLALEVPGGRRGAATRTFDVPPATGLRLSTPILTDRIVESGERTPRAVVRGLKAFWPKATLYCQYEVYGARRGPTKQPVVDAGYAVTAEDGRVVRSAAPSRIAPSEDGRVMRIVGFPLGDLPPGGYTVAIDVRDTVAGTSASARDAFRLQAVRR